MDTDEVPADADARINAFYYRITGSFGKKMSSGARIVKRPSYPNTRTLFSGS